MDAAYTIRAQDGQQYGPYPLESIRQWIGEGRITAGTPMTRSDLTEWYPAGSFTEVEFGAPPQAAPAEQVPTARAATAAASGGGVAIDEGTLAAVRPGANWFYWIGGLTLVNAGACVFGADFRMALAWEVVDFAAAITGAGVVGIALYLLAVGFSAICGWFGSKAAVWAFVLGGLAYAGDAVLCLVFQDWLSLALHGWALFAIFGGLKNALAIRKAIRARAG